MAVQTQEGAFLLRLLLLVVVKGSVLAIRAYMLLLDKAPISHVDIKGSRDRLLLRRNRRTCILVADVGETEVPLVNHLGRPSRIVGHSLVHLH